MNFFLILGKFHSLFLYCQKMFNELTSISVISSSLWWGGQFYSSRYLIFHQFSEAATGGVLLKKVFLEISQNSQENTCARVFFNKVMQAGLRPVNLLKNRVWHGRFPVNFAKFRRTPFSQKTSGRLLLKILGFFRTVSLQKPFERIEFSWHSTKSNSLIHLEIERRTKI